MKKREFLIEADKDVNSHSKVHSDGIARVTITTYKVHYE